MAAPPSASCKRSLLREEIAASERLPPSSEAAAEQLQGEWLLGLSASESALAFAPPDAQQTFSGGSFERLAPAPLGLVASAGSFELSGEGGAKKGGALQLGSRRTAAGSGRCRCRRAPPTRSCCTSTPSSASPAAAAAPTCGAAGGAAREREADALEA